MKFLKSHFSALPAFTLIVLLLSACNSKPEPLIFSSNDAGVPQIYLMNELGEISLLSLNKGRAVNPALSPDKTKLAYLSEETGAWDIRIRNLNDDTEINISNSPAMDGPPAWSPDGKFIAHMAKKESNRDIFIYNLESKERRQVTFNKAIDVDPLWSPSLANVIYFKSIRDSYEGIYQLNIADSTVAHITPQRGSNTKAQVLPGSARLSYVHYSNERYQIIVFHEDSSESQTILFSDEKINGYHWSQEAKYLALDLDEKIELYAFDGLQLDYLEEIPFGEFPRWAEKSNKLFYNLNDDEGAQLFVYNLDKNKVEMRSPASFNAYQPIPLN